jgi:ribosomal protein S12 methylthiotransferase accessory factor YcaO
MRWSASQVRAVKASESFPCLAEVELFEITSSCLLIRSDRALFQLRGPGVVDVALALDGTKSTEDLATAFGSSKVDTVVAALAGGEIVYHSSEALRELAVEAEDVIVELAKNLRMVAIQAVYTDSYFRPGLRTEIEAAASSSAVCLVKGGSSILWLGPLFRRESAPCCDCFLGRIKARDEHAAVLASAVYRRRGGRSLRRGGGHLAAMIVAHVPQLEPGIVFGIDLESLTVSRHFVGSYGRCTRCAGTVTPRPVTPRPPASRGELWDLVEARVGRLVDSFAGVVTDVRVCTKPNSAAPLQVAMAQYSDPTGGHLCRYAIDPHSQRIVGRAVLKRTAFGAGRTASDARARAVLEAVERYSSFWRGDEANIVATMTCLGDAALHPGRLMHYSDAQLRHPNWREGDTARELRVPEPFDEAAAIHWTGVASLCGVACYIPTALCYNGFRASPDVSFCTYDGSGTAAGFTVNDAIVRGFLELVERDAAAIWWYNRLSRPTVELGTFGEAMFDEICARHRASGRDLIVVDITHDLGVCVFVAISVGGSVPLFGFGAHVEPREALCSALMELEQAVCFEESETKKWVGTDWALHTPWIFGSSQKRGAADYAKRDTFLDPGGCQGIAAAAGLEVFVLDCTRPDVGLPTVRVIVPGLRPLWPRFGPGRLWDVPQRLGWLQASTPLGGVNGEYFRS